MVYLRAFAVCLLALGTAAVPTPRLSLRETRSSNDASSPQARIVGGMPVMVSELAFVCSIRYLSNDVCGCSIIASNYVLTSASCTDILPTPEGVTITAGSVVRGTGQVFTVDDFYVHPDFDRATMNYDAAVLHTRDLVQGEDIELVPLAAAGQRAKDWDELVVAGYGSTTPPVPPPAVPPAPPLPPPPPVDSPNMQKAVLVKIPDEQCAQAYIASPIAITSAVICAAAPGAGACVGDLGSPLLKQNAPDGPINVQYGIASTVMGCGNPALPNVFTNIANKSVRDFIQQNAHV